LIAFHVSLPVKSYMGEGYLGLSAAQVRIAVDYFADYPTEIDAWLAKVDAQAAELEELIQRRQEMLR
jgi:hypothetical protein